MTHLHTLDRHGDKENSPFFEQYLPKVYTRRVESGVDALLGKMLAVAVQVQRGDVMSFLAELYLMTPYRLAQTTKTTTHRVFELHNGQCPDLPRYYVVEPLTVDYTDIYTNRNVPHARGAEKPQVKYLGEIFRTKDRVQLKNKLEAQQVRFLNPKTTNNSFLAHSALLVTEPSYYTNNSVIYSEALPTAFGEVITLTDDEANTLELADKTQAQTGVKGLIKGIDHLATRVLSGDREHALLELLTLTPYYFWGAYTIDEQNSSTNICRLPNQTDELNSPAKVFTANNTPWYVGTINGLPSPTENFVRNFGKRMHHMAYAVPDGKRDNGLQNIDFVVQTLSEQNIPFLAKVFGECRDIPDLKQIFSKTSPYSFLITEYVQRCHNFAGFFTRANVADLTAAAGEDAQLRTEGVND